MSNRPAISGMRPLTVEEQHAISAPALKVGCLAWVALSLSGWLISSLIFVGVCTRMQYSAPLESPWFLIIILAFWTCVSVGLSRWQKARVARQQTARLNQAANDVAEIFTFAVVDAIQVEEFEDEGSSYFLRLTDEKILFLSGQYLYDYEASKQFPCTHFDVVRRSRLDFVIEIVCRGNYLAPSKVLKPFRTEQFQQDTVPEDMTYVDVSWDEIESTYSQS